MASDVTINNALDFQAQTSRSSAQLAEDFDDFLVLLTTQLQNQDPLSPMDSTEFTNQLVNFAGVEQQINSNQKLDALVANSIGSAFSSALSYVGLDISYLSSEAYFDGTKPINVNYAIEGASVDTTINVLDETGRLVYSQKVSDDESIEQFTWDGTMSGGGIAQPGTYEIQVAALDAAGEAIKTSTVVTGHVNGIETQNGTTFLLVGERAVSLGNVINVSKPQDIPATTTTPAETTDTQDQQQTT